MAEVIKYGVIADRSLFESLEGGMPANGVEMIRRCVEIKAKIVSEDEKEITGKRALLNFGHTLGHAIENAAGYGVLLHGEAVALGMRAAAQLSREFAGMPEADVQKIDAILNCYRLPLRAPHLSWDRIQEAMKSDKKVLSGKIRWVLSSFIGEAHLTDQVPFEAVEKVAKSII